MASAESRMERSKEGLYNYLFTPDPGLCTVYRVPLTSLTRLILPERAIPTHNQVAPEHFAFRTKQTPSREKLSNGRKATNTRR